MRLLFAAFLCFAAAGSVNADEFRRLFDAMKIDEVVAILAEEGIPSALDLETSMFAGAGGARWQGEVTRIYNREVRQSELKDTLRQSLQEADLEPILAFLESERGRRITALEVSARRAFIDPEMEEMAREIFSDAEETRPELFDQVREFTDVNDLVALNVEGSFRSNVAFALGVHETGGFPGLPIDELVDMLWEGDEAAEVAIANWLNAYLMTAYGPLPEGDLQAYIAFSRSDIGQEYNAAIMASFDALFADISYDLGRAAGRYMTQRDL